MASARVQVGGLGALKSLARLNLMDEVEGAVETALEAGEAAMKEAIATRGTGNTWSHPWHGRTGSKPGRVDTGDMQNDVRGIITDRTRTEVTGNLGWDEDSPDYYRYQEQGFMHVLTGKDVEGMMALRDAAELTRNVLVDEIDNITRRI